MRKPIITEKTQDTTATLDHWKEEFWCVYSEPDLRRDLHKTWSMACEDAARVGEAIREDRPKNCLKYLAHTFCWIASFVAKLEHDPTVHGRFKIPGFQYQLSKVVWEKYPRVCPRCTKPKCRCPVLEKKDLPNETKREKILKEKRRSKEPPEAMKDWGDMFADIYDKAHFIRSLGELGFHLLEEMGEVEEVIRKIATYETLHLPQRSMQELQSDLVKEVADTVSWCFSIVRKIAKDAENLQEVEEVYGRKQKAGQLVFITPALTLSQVLWEEYRRKDKDAKGNIIKYYDEIGCPVCGERACSLGQKEKWVLTAKGSSNEERTL